MPKAEQGDPRRLVTLAELLWLHTVAVVEFGGSDGVRDRGLLESALARPLAGFGGRHLYETACLRAAALAEALIQNHGFVDGNKRAAMYAMALWLERESLILNAEQDELVEFAVGLAVHRIDLATAAKWLERRTVGAR